jgi:hypothetical protein
MNCARHPEVDSSAFCVSCGTALCASCRRDVEGSVYCESCLANVLRGGAGRARSAGAHVSAGGENPGAAFALGLIPGVGAIYNGEFFKAAIHIMIFGFLVSLGDLGGPIEGVFTLLGIGFYFYMPFEAYYTSKKRKLMAEGIDLETPIDRFHQQFGEFENKELWGGIALVLLGGIFLADSFRFLLMREIFRFWPVIFIVVGIWLVWRHKEERAAESGRYGRESSRKDDRSGRQDEGVGHGSPSDRGSESS